MVKDKHIILFIVVAMLAILSLFWQLGKFTDLQVEMSKLIWNQQNKLADLENRISDLEKAASVKLWISHNTSTVNIQRMVDGKPKTVYFDRLDPMTYYHSEWVELK